MLVVIIGYIQKKQLPKPLVIALSCEEVKLADFQVIVISTQYLPDSHIW